METVPSLEEQQAEIRALGDATYAASQVPENGLPVDPATVSMPNLATARRRPPSAPAANLSP